jgi:hypothetical protein
MNRRRMWGTVTLAAMLGLVARGVAAQCCGDCDGNGQVAVSELVSTVNRALEGCSDDGICSVSTCPGQLAECKGDLADCRAQPGGQALPVTGQRPAGRIPHRFPVPGPGKTGSSRRERRCRTRTMATVRSPTA